MKFHQHVACLHVKHRRAGRPDATVQIAYRASSRPPSTDVGTVSFVPVITDQQSTIRSLDRPLVTVKFRFLL